MGRLYFYESSVKNDKVSRLTVFSRSAERAFSYAAKQFKKHGCVGVPINVVLS